MEEAANNNKIADSPFEDIFETYIKPDIDPHSRQPRRKIDTDVDMSQLKALVLFGLPENINNKAELNKRLEVYGNIVRIVPNPSKGTASVHFLNHTSAAQAKASKTTFEDVPDLKILWKQPTRTAAKTKSKDRTPFASDITSETNKSVAMASTRKETAKHSVIDDSLIMKASLEELYQIIALPAKSMSDKVALLDARDRIVRLRREALQKSNAASGTKNLKGTCPDMCPEKERYSRCEKRRLAAYEMIETSGKDYEVDHRFAVKEYSRSSADQAEPLPHELRPLRVLEMTANYLFSTIADRCDAEDENLGDWYNFLWDRTRGIRKDITQQSLCELGSVDLVEKCARFHIHCTARLCELDMQDFDQKINDENLTKCLQTLKHMYHDLSLKRIFCPNEAEFRSYDVLLHLNDGNTLRDVLQLRKEIRDSPLVQTALNFFHSVNARNYVRFFKLAQRNGHYLQCCLLQRYFNQVRSKALQIMVQAYGPPKNGQVPFSWIVSILGFENPEEARTCFETHGLNVDIEKDVVLLERQKFTDIPEKFPSVRRSFRLIENKRRGPLNLIIANGLVNIEALANHRPQNSFDLNGFLKKEALFEEEQTDENRTRLQEDVIPRNSKFSIVDTLSSLMFNDVMLRETRAITNNAVKEALYERSREKVIYLGTKKLWDECLRDVLFEFVKDSYSEFLSKELQRKQEERKQQHKRLKREEFIMQVLNDTINRTVHEAIIEVVEDEINESIAKRHETLDTFATAISSRLLHQVVAEEVGNISRDVGSEEIHKRETLVLKASTIVRQHRLRRCFKKWTKFTKRKINLREEQRIFPACPSRLALEQQVSLLSSSGESRRSSKRKSLVDQSTKAKRISNLIDLQDHILKIDNSYEQKHIDLFEIFTHLAKATSCEIPFKVWKLVFVNLNCQNASAMLKKWIRLKGCDRIGNCWPYQETRKLPSGAMLTISVELKESYKTSCGHGADAVILIYESSKGVGRVLETFSKNFSLDNAVVGTLAVLHSENRNAHNIPTKLRSVWDVQISVEGSSSLSYFRANELLVNVLKNSLHELLSRKPKEMSLWEFVHGFLLKTVLPTIDHDLQDRCVKGLPHRSLETLVNFYDERISELIELVEVNVRKGFIFSHSASIVQLLRNYLILPNPASELGKLDGLIAYCTTVTIAELDPSSFISRIMSITTKCDWSTSNVPWTEIFQACLDYRMQAFVHAGSEVTMKLSLDFSQCVKEAFGRSANWNYSFLPETKGSGDIDEDVYYPGASPPILEQSYSRTFEVPQNIQALCERISLVSSQAAEDNEFLQRSLSLPSLPPPKSPKFRYQHANLTLAENLALLEQRIDLARRDDNQFESFLAHVFRR